MKASEFDEKFDADEDLMSCLDISRAYRPGLEENWIHINLPLWAVQCLDEMAERLGISRQDMVARLVKEYLAKDRSAGDVTSLVGLGSGGLPNGGRDSGVRRHPRRP
jgi:hypothetical protein